MNPIHPDHLTTKERLGEVCRLLAIPFTEEKARDALLQPDPLWDELFPGEQARIVQLLVERVEMAEDGLDIRFRTEGLAGLVREFGVDARKAA